MHPKCVITLIKYKFIKLCSIVRLRKLQCGESGCRRPREWPKQFHGQLTRRMAAEMRLPSANIERQGPPKRYKYLRSRKPFIKHHLISEFASRETVLKRRRVSAHLFEESSLHRFCPQILLMLQLFFMLSLEKMVLLLEIYNVLPYITHVHTIHFFQFHFLVFL